MKFNCGPTRNERKAASKYRAVQEKRLMMEWHSWFAWFPVHVASGDCRWLERIERRFMYCEVRWEYGFRGKYVVVWHSLEYRAAP